MKVTVEVEEEVCTPVQGNALASGNDVADKECEDEILARVASGDALAWCSLKVTAEHEGFTETIYLGCCSFLADTSQEDIEEHATDHGLQDEVMASLSLKLVNAVRELGDAKREAEEALSTLIERDRDGDPIPFATGIAIATETGSVRYEGEPTAKALKEHLNTFRSKGQWASATATRKRGPVSLVAL